MTGVGGGPAFLGEYLLKSGLISEQQLVAAVALQEQVNWRLGTCATSLGFLTAEQVAEIHEAQKQTDMPFGRLAVKLGKLTRLQLEQAIEYQRFKHLLIGNALVESGAMKAEALLRAIEMFNAASGESGTMGAPALHAPTLDDNIGVAQQELIECAQRLLVRIANLRTKQSSWQPLDPGPSSNLNTNGVQLAGTSRLDLWLSMSEETTQVLANALWSTSSPHRAPDSALDTLLQMICNHSVAALDKRGQQWTVGPVHRMWSQSHSREGCMVLLLTPDHPAIEVRVVRA